MLPSYCAPKSLDICETSPMQPKFYGSYQHLRLPLCHLIRTHLVLSSDLGNGLVAADRFQSHLCLGLP
jgi:hypothetical protein